MNNANFFPFERNRYFYGKLLTVRDFEVEQRYHCTKRELLNRLVHGAGVVCGLGVTASDESTLMIESGMALDYQGREIVLPETLFRKLAMLEGQETLSGKKDAYLCLAYAEEDYFEAEQEFQFVLGVEEDPALLRRCYLSLAETYRDSLQFDETIQIIQEALSRPEIGAQNSVFYEMLGAAYYTRGTVWGGGDEDLRQAAESFQSAIQLGAQKDYLYVNAFTAWQAIGEYDKAGAVLDQMEEAYPHLYTPNALRATLWIMEENQKDQSQRNYRPAYEQYELAQEKVTSQDETTQLQQLEGLIQQLKSGGWL